MLGAKGTLLLVGAGHQAFREYSLRSIAERYPVALLTDEDPSWQRGYVTWHAQVDFGDRSEVSRSARRLAAQANATGLLTWDERYVELCADLAGELGLPCCAPEAIRICKDKARLRSLLGHHDGLRVRFAVAHGQAAVARAAEAIGYPIVVKPRGLGGSAGVVKVSDRAELENAFLAAAGAHIGATVSAYDGVLVEEYLEGPEYSVDSITVGGETTPLVVAEKTVGFAPYFEELGHFVPPRAPAGLEDALALVRRVHRIVGLDRIVTHTELRLTPTGPRIIEINCRLGGDLIPYLGQLALGVDLSRAAAEIAMDEVPQIDASAKCTAAVRFFYPTMESVVEEVRLPLPDEAYPGLVSFQSIVAPGQELRLPPHEFLSRLGFAVVTGADEQACTARLDRVQASMVVAGRPLAEAA